jgi:hypothetical protein
VVPIVARRSTVGCVSSSGVTPAPPVSTPHPARGICGDRRARKPEHLMALALSPFIVLLASGSRLIIIIGNYDTTTATTMAASGGLGQTVLGTVIPLLPAFLPVALVVLAIFRQWGLLLFAAAATALLSPAYIGVEEGWHRAYPQFRSAAAHAWHWQWHALWQDSRLLVWCAILDAGFVLWKSLLRGNIDQVVGAPIKALLSFPWAAAGDPLGRTPCSA